MDRTRNKDLFADRQSSSQELGEHFLSDAPFFTVTFDYVIAETSDILNACGERRVSHFHKIHVYA